MPDKPLEQACDARVCIHTDQILDSCMDKDCVEDLRVYLTRESQAALDRSTGAKTRCAELLFARVEVEPLAYKRGHYAVDLTFYYRILGDATVGGTRPVTITGLAVFTKRVALYGGRGKAKTFSSTDALPTPDGLLQDRLPVGVVEALDPMILASKVREVCDCCRCETELTEIPPAIAEALGEELVLTGGTRRLYVTVGQFSTVRLERGAQLAVQSGGYCMPTRVLRRRGLRGGPLRAVQPGGLPRPRLLPRGERLRRNELLRQLRKVSGEKRAAARLRRCSGRQNGTGFRNCHCEAPKGPWQSRSTILDNKQASAKT